MLTSKDLGEIALIFLAFRDQLKIYHWQTKIYSRHKASGKLVDFLTEKMDQFIETLQGSRNLRLKLSNSIINFRNISDDNIVPVLEAFINWLNIVLPTKLEPMDNDLRNLRDEILSKVNQTLYLFTLK